MATAAAKRYARAVFELAQDERRVDEWRDQLTALREVLSDPAVSSVLSNPTIASTRRMELIGSAGSLNREAANLAMLLIDSNRVNEIDAVVGEFERLADDAEGRVRAVVTTAVALEDSEREGLARSLSQRLGKDVRLGAQVDPRIIGGLKLQYGDRLIDATIATRLQQLRRRLAEAT